MQRLPFPASKSFIRSRRSKLSLTALALGVNGTTPTTPSPIFATRLAADMVNGARKLLFTVPFTAPFTLQAWEALGDTEVVNCTWTQAEHRTGLERPHFGQVLVAKRHTGRSSPRHSLRASILLVSRGREMRREAQLSEIEVKEVRIPLCTSVIATSSPSELLKTHVAGKMRSENEAKAVGKNCRKWAGATHHLGFHPPKWFFGVAPAHYACHTQLVASV